MVLSLCLEVEFQVTPSVLILKKKKSLKLFWTLLCGFNDLELLLLRLLQGLFFLVSGTTLEYRRITKPFGPGDSQINIFQKQNGRYVKRSQFSSCKFLFRKSVFLCLHLCTAERDLSNVCVLVNLGKSQSLWIPQCLFSELFFSF